MDLVADRFVIIAPGTALDLATGDRVEFIVSSRGGAGEQAAWAARCDRFATLRHRVITRLVDYGALGECHRFEAWRCDGEWRGMERRAAEAMLDATRFLQANGWSIGDLGRRSVRATGTRTTVRPEASTGLEVHVVAPQSSRAELSADLIGVSIVRHQEMDAIVEIFQEEKRSAVRVIGLAPPQGAQIDSAICQIAGAARLHGYVPISMRALELLGANVSIVAGRSILLLASAGAAQWWRALVHLSLISPRPHVAVIANGTASGVSSIVMGRLAPEALCNAVMPQRWRAGLHREVTVAARRADGSLERFIELLWGQPDMIDRPKDSRLHVAEGAVVYGEHGAEPMPVPRVGNPSQWPAPGELTALRRRLEVGINQLQAGRHAAGGRTVRQTAAFLSRRGDWTHATRGAIALARSLLKRGHSRNADVVLRDARRAAERCGDIQMLFEISVLAGTAAIDEGRLDEAEAVLSAAVAAAREVNERSSIVQATLAWARCLFWKDRPEEMVGRLAELESQNLSEAERLQLAAHRSRAAVARGDVPGAIAQAAVALGAAKQIGLPAGLATAAYSAAFAYLALGDYHSISEHLTTTIRAARQTHDPLASLRARLIAAEVQRRQGRRAYAVAICRRAGRMQPQDLPRIVRARIDLLAALLHESDEADVASRCARTSGFPALRLFGSLPRETKGTTAVSDIVAILNCCQTAEDDSRVLDRLCADLRQRLRATAVAVFAEARGAMTPVAADGGRIEIASAARVYGLDDVLMPHAMNGPVEGGAVVRYGGRSMGALIARWTAGASYDASNAGLLLTTAATAAAPAVASVRTQQMASAATTKFDLLGIGPAMVEVRRAVERAARAPFAVLVVGESGSGKELVARAVHRNSPRRDRPFCTLNCAALPDELVESELFGHSRGAFTGAVADRPGVFEEAHTGTLFLDEIGELSPRAQAKVLRTIQEGELRRVGENMARRVDVRLVAATNRDLSQETRTGRFRLDLLYRLDVVRIAVPPLRDRREDIPLLAEHFWTECTSRVGSRATLGAATLSRLARYDWPGNVRELQNVLAALAVRTPRRGVVPPSALPPHFDGKAAADSYRLDLARKTFEAEFVRAALSRTGGHRTQAAAELGLTRQGLTKLMSRLGITDNRPENDVTRPIHHNSRDRLQSPHHSD